ncbi:MAG: sigma-70 family RNA polymerase sigma factor [Gammaproteobacteria bacterium]|nr:MAG: sigma-70 family RNA polymerase sigma factor [Gammaproteobacteria bacterium]
MTTAPFECVTRAWADHEHELRRFLIGQLREGFQAEDVLQDVFLKAMRQGQAFCELENPRAWLYRVARTTLVDHVRRQKPVADLSAADSVDFSDAPESGRAPVDELDACILRNLPQLSADDRAILEACDLQGQTVRAYAEAQGLRLSAAKSRLLRARQRLREALIRNCQVNFDEDTGQVCCHQASSPF